MIKKLLIEMKTILTGIFSPFGIKHEELVVPADLKKKGVHLGLFNFVVTILGLIFSYMLKLTNLMIEMRFILLGIIFFMLYYGEHIVRAAVKIVDSTEHNKYNLMFDNAIILRGSKILSEVSGKVQKQDEKTKIYSTMSNETTINVIKRYLSNLWELKIYRIFNILGIVSTILMIIMAIVTNDAIDQRLFIPVLLVFSVLSFVTTAYISVVRKTYHEKGRKCYDRQDEVTNDLIRVEPIVKNDVSMRISLLSSIIQSNNNNIIDFNRKRNVASLITRIVETLSSYGIILLYIFGVNWQEISVATIAQIMANIVIVTTALNQISQLTSMLDGFSEKVTITNREEKEMRLIIDAYDKSIIRNKEAKEISTIVVPTFKISYIEESENDKPFTLKSEYDITINSGDVAILYGPSGSGKSTFMKLLTERISVEKNVNIPSTSRCVHYDERLKFGSLSVYAELFCNSNSPDYEKMKAILINLHLWQEISANCVDTWQYLKEKKYNHFSNGQKQRLILAKLLYWLDETIDVVVLDECTSGLDDVTTNSEYADAQRILEYIVNYCNADKKRIIVISTHQNIDNFISNITDKFNIQKLQFIRKEDCNIVK